MIRVKAILLVVASAAAVVGFLVLQRHVPTLQWHHRWNFANHTFYIALSLLALALAGRTLTRYGLTLREWRKQLLYSAGPVAIVCVPALIIGVATDSIGPSRAAVRYPIATALFQLVFVAFGEELLFRGFWQGELNAAFGTPFRLGRTRFGAGLIAVTLIFGVGHLLNPMWAGNNDLNWIGLWSTGGFAAVTGLLRDRFGSILAPAVLHAGINTLFVWISTTPAAGIAVFACAGVLLGLVVLVLACERPTERATPALASVATAASG